MITFANSLFQFLPQNHYILPPVLLSLQEKLYLFAIKNCYVQNARMNTTKQNLAKTTKTFKSIDV